MAKLSLTKSGLQKQRNELKLYQKLLPSLDLKRLQLTAELQKAQKQSAELEAAVQRLEAQTAQQIPMMANHDIDLSGLVRITAVNVRQENVVGVNLPVLDEADVTCVVADYSMLAKPYWVDVLALRLQQMATLRLRTQVAAERARQLEYAVRRITQRVNLFEKILIPTAKKNIQRIQIFLGDAERSAVVRSKLAKAIHQRQRKAAHAKGAAA